MEEPGTIAKLYDSTLDQLIKAQNDLYESHYLLFLLFLNACVHWTIKICLILLNKIRITKISTIKPRFINN